MRTVAVFNQKGGCGKTTTAINLAACLAEAGKRTLLVDLDPQAHSTIGSNVKMVDVECSTYDCLIGRQNGCAPLGLADIAWEIVERLSLAPGSLMLSGFEQQARELDDPQERLLRAIETADPHYEWAVVDCGPSMNLLNINAVRAADTVLIPVETGFFSLESVDRARETVALVAERTGHEPHVLVLPTMYDPRTKSDRAAYQRLKQRQADVLAETTIRFNAKLKEAAAAGSPITEFLPGCRGHRDHQHLAGELMARSFELQMLNDDRSARTARMAEARTIDELARDVLGPQVTGEGVVFTTRAPGAERVRLAGSFNNWNPEAGDMVPVPGREHLWRRVLPLDAGRYEYRLVIDTRWSADPDNPYTEPNEFGELNSVVDVQID